MNFYGKMKEDCRNEFGVWRIRGLLIRCFVLTCAAKEGEVEPRWCRRKPSLCERHGDRGELCATQDEVS